MASTDLRCCESGHWDISSCSWATRGAMLGRGVGAIHVDSKFAFEVRNTKRPRVIHLPGVTPRIKAGWLVEQ